ncbi:tail fiber assembly protein [Pseudodesulfovibrio cashew]|uniref:tail fiber assembly protein n=1 Tax=Pseudodesulfovibrio cashew TaxID=2678688 RepID=UPI001F55841F|nr:tail fiber assembly protein [Pseudodesulfovibrio cashew]
MATTARAERDARLAASDWTQLADHPLDDTAMVLWQSYRQALRDVPQQDGFPETVSWPEQPATE